MPLFDIFVNTISGFGRGSAVTMFVTYYGSDPDGLTAVLWPSAKQPIETFQARGTWTMAYPEGNPYQGNPWSYFINTNAVTVNTAKLKVTLVCDRKQTDVLEFSQLSAAEKSENRVFTIGSNPLKQLIGFRPHVAYTSGDKVTVTIESIEDKSGLPVPVTYDVHFFQTGTTPYPHLTGAVVNRNAETTAAIRLTSDYAGTLDADTGVITFHAAWTYEAAAPSITVPYIVCKVGKVISPVSMETVNLYAGGTWSADTMCRRSCFLSGGRNSASRSTTEVSKPSAAS